MKTKDDSLIRQLRSIDPVDEAALRRELLDTDVEELLQSILGSDPPEPERERPRREARPPLFRRLAAPAAIAGILVAAIVLTLVGAVGGGDNAVSALDDVAAAAAAAPAPAQGLPYTHLKTRSTSVDTAVAKGEAWSVRRTETREVWLADDRPGRLRVTVDPPEFVGPGDRTAWEAAGRPSFLAGGFEGRSFERPIPAGEGGREDLGLDPTTLPTDPDLLYEKLAQQAVGGRSSAPPGARTLDLIAATLRDPATPPEVRAALYEAAIAIPGIEYLGEATDSIGRRGLAVGVTSDYSGAASTYSLIYDPETSQVLETRTTALEPPEFADAEPPFTVSATTYVKSSYTN